MPFKHHIHPRVQQRRWYQRPITWAFSLLLGLVVLISTLTALNLKELEREFVQESLVNIEKLRLIDEMVHLLRQRSVLLRDFIINEDPFDQDEIAQQHSAIASNYLAIRNEFASFPLSPEENILLGEIIKLNAESYQLQNNIISLALSSKMAEALNLMAADLIPNRITIFTDMDNMRNSLLLSVDDTRQTAVALIGTSRTTVNSFFVLSVALGFLIIWLAYKQDSRHNSSLHWQSSHDPLTGLGNRYETDSRLSLLLDDTKNEHKQHALIYLDIDHFNIINNTSGHAAGDELLKQVSSQLRSMISAENTIDRVGSDQFVVLLMNQDVYQAKKCAKKIITGISKHRFEWSNRSYDVTVSASVVPVSAGRGKSEAIWSDAYLACDIAKERGGNCIEVSIESTQEAKERREVMDWTTRLRLAMKEERLILYSQGIRSINSGIQHSEILIRYEKKNGAIISAAKFIPAAEQYNMVTEIDFYVVRKTLQFMADDSSGHSYSINLSGLSLGNSELLDLIISEINNKDINPELVCFEITETAAIRNHSSAVQFMNILHGLGCHFFLDDFGSGLSSFGYLRTLPLDMIKIDAYFIRNLDTDAGNRAVVDAIHMIAHGFGMSTIAEGVENERQLEILRVIGVDFVQGYLIGKPARLVAT